MSASEKSTLRGQIRQLRRTWTPEQTAAWSRAIMARCLAHPAVQQARVLFTYIGGAGEVQTCDLIITLLARGKTVAVPKLDPHRPGHMSAAVIPDLAQCEIDPAGHHIPAPKQIVPLSRAPEVILVPVLAVTEQGHRLGQGGGYYDRYLAQQRASVSIALAFDAQVVASLPTAPHDQGVGWIITPTRTLHCVQPPPAPGP